jgi:NAD dependent epimerase/dehydratase family enzyme
MKGFARTLGRVMKRPAWLPVPAFLLRLLFGQMAEETLLAGQKVLPRALLKTGFRFSYPDLESALLEILR